MPRGRSRLARSSLSPCDEVTLSRKGLKSQTQDRKVRSTGTKATNRVDRAQPRHDLEQQLEEYRRELAEAREHLSEALEQQTATSEVLRVISSSPGELEPVFQAMLENAVRICDAKFGTLHRFDGKMFRPAAGFGTPRELYEFQKRRGPFRPEPGGPLDRVLNTKQVYCSADEAAEARPGVSARLGGARSLVAVPMLQEDELVGAILIYRQEVKPFTPKQIELVSNFAAPGRDRHRERAPAQRVARAHRRSERIAAATDGHC
jgi:hypothetical protein